MSNGDTKNHLKPRLKSWSLDWVQYPDTVVLHNVLYAAERLVKYELQYIAQEYKWIGGR